MVGTSGGRTFAEGFQMPPTAAAAVSTRKKTSWTYGLIPAPHGTVF